MPLTNLQKVEECIEIIGKDEDFFDSWEQGFLADMEEKLQQPWFCVTPNRQAKIDEIYAKACDSPY
jgi:hypothetical protein